MTPLEKVCRRARQLGVTMIELKILDDGIRATLIRGNDWLGDAEGRDSMTALRSACDSYECSLQSEPESKRDRAARERHLGPSSAPTEEATDVMAHRTRPVRREAN